MTKTASTTHSPEARAERVRQLRKSLHLSRKTLSDKYKKYGITASALQSWEDVRWNGLTEKGAQRLVQAFQDEGAQVTVEWLMFGIGDDPRGIIFPSALLPTPSLSEQENIAQELRLFHQLNSDAVDTVVSDDGCAPWLAIGDYVAGKRYFGHDIDKAIGHPSIVQTLSGNVLVRMVNRGNMKEHYTLSCSNPATTAKQAIIENTKLFSAAPILWIRKPEINR